MSLDAAHNPIDAQPSDDGSAVRDAAWETERAALLAKIEAAVDAADPHPVARRTLAFLVEAEFVVVPEALGDRVVGGADTSQDLGGMAATLDDLVEGLRGRHPALFKPQEPEAVAAVEPLAPIAKPESAASHLWAKQSARARVLVAESGARARILARTARTRLLQVRTRAEERFTEILPDAEGQVPGDTTVPSSPSKILPTTFAAKADHVGGQATKSAARLRNSASALAAAAVERGRLGLDDVRDAVGPGGILRRPSTIAALAGAGFLGLVVLVATREDQTVPETPAPTSASPEPTTAPAPSGPADSVRTKPVPAAKPSQPSPVSDDEPAPDDAPMQAEIAPQAGEISGPADVIDTATLKIGGRVVRLFGVVWVRGGQTEELARYLGKRAVSCRPVAGSDAHLCSVDGRDLSEVVLFNGGGRASPEATPDLVAAEDRARSERLGVWAR